MTTRKAGRYELLEELGRGAMGVVFKAYDPMIGRVVAVKTMKLVEVGTGMPRPEMLARFQTEARAAGQLVHPNIVVIHDAGEDEGVYYITMEFVEGHSLQALMDKKQPFPLPRTMRIMGQVCSALEYAHQRNVVHRDVKPANIVLGGDDTVKITDFGTAKILALGTTQSGTIIGTPSFMAPEQIKGKPIDGRCDIFALGVIVYELVTGEKPFPGDNVTTVIYKIVHEEPIPPRELDSSVHPGLSEVILKSLAKEPEKRYQTCREMMQDLLNYRALGGGVAPSFESTLVVVGRPGPASTPQSYAQPIPSQTGTVPGIPSLDTGMPSAAPPPPPAPPAPTASAPPSRPEPMTTRAPSTPVTPSSESQRLFPSPLPPLSDAQARQAPPAPVQRPMTLPPLPIDREEIFTEAEPPERRYGWVFAIILLMVLGVGGYFIWPALKETFFPAQQTETQQPIGEPKPAEAKPAESTVSQHQAKATQPEESKPKESKPAESSAPPRETKATAESKKPAAEPSATKAGAVALQSSIEDRLARSGFRDKVRVEVREHLIRLTGSLSKNDLRRLKQRFRVPAGYTVEYAFEEPEAAAATAKSPEVVETKPHTAPGLGEIEVLTDVSGADVVLKGPQNIVLEQAKTPYRFEDLKPGRYSVEITKEGYRTERKILNVRAGNVAKVELSLQTSVARLQVSSAPAGAEIIVDGRPTGQKTPATLNLAPGNRRVVLQKPGYEPYEKAIKLEENELQKLDVSPLTPRVQAAKGPGWVEVRTVPRGVDILIDNTNTGRRTPDKLELPAGEYTLTLYLKGYQVVRERIVIKPNETLQLNRTLPPQ